MTRTDRSRRRHALIRGALPALVCTIAACATLGLESLVAPRFESVDEPTSRLRVLPPGGGRPAGGASLRMWTRVENPNPIGITVAELAGRLYLEDAPVEVDFPLGLPLEARGDTLIPLDVTIGFEDVPRLAEIAARALMLGDPVAYRLEGTIAVDAGRLGTPRFGPSTILRGELEPVR